MNKLKVNPSEKSYFFEWLAEQRLKNYSNGVPRTGVFIQENGYPDIDFSTEHEFMQLVVQTEKEYPEFSYESEILKLTYLTDLDYYRQKKRT